MIRNIIIFIVLVIIISCDSSSDSQIRDLTMSRGLFANKDLIESVNFIDLDDECIVGSIRDIKLGLMVKKETCERG